MLENPFEGFIGHYNAPLVFITVVTKYDSSAEPDFVLKRIS